MLSYYFDVFVCLPDIYLGLKCLGLESGMELYQLDTQIFLSRTQRKERGKHLASNHGDNKVIECCYFMSPPTCSFFPNSVIGLMPFIFQKRKLLSRELQRVIKPLTTNKQQQQYLNLKLVLTSGYNYGLFTLLYFKFCPSLIQLTVPVLVLRSFFLIEKLETKSGSEVMLIFCHPQMYPNFTIIGHV